MKTKEPKTINLLNDLERKVYDLCLEDRIALNSNTILCIRFWQRYGRRDDKLIEENIVELYQPESITRARRHLVEWGLLTPDKEIQKKRMETARNWKTPNYMKRTEIQWRDGIPYQVITN